MRATVADYQVIGPWGPRTGRYTCRPPQRLGLAGPVLVSELTAAGERWAELCDVLIRVAHGGGAAVVDLIEVGPGAGPDVHGYIVTEAAPAGTLAEPARTLTAAERISALAAAAEAAHSLHEIGLVHGAISPGSVLLTDRGPALDLPRIGGPPGSVAVVASWADVVMLDPDLLGGGRPSRSSDVWALGATIHTVMGGRPLFPGMETDDPVTAVQRMLFTRPEVDPSLASAIRDLVSRCLSADPADRPLTALVVAEALTSTGAGL